MQVSDEAVEQFDDLANLAMLFCDQCAFPSMNLRYFVLLL